MQHSKSAWAISFLDEIKLEDEHQKHNQPGPNASGFLIHGTSLDVVWNNIPSLENICSMDLEFSTLKGSLQRSNP